MDDRVIFVAIDDLSNDVVATVHRLEDTNWDEMLGDETYTWFVLNLSTGSIFQLT